MYYWSACPELVRGVKPEYCGAAIASPGPNIEQFETAVNEGIEKLRNNTADLTGKYWVRDGLFDIKGRGRMHAFFLVTSYFFLLFTQSVIFFKSKLKQVY